MDNFFPNYEKCIKERNTGTFAAFIVEGPTSAVCLEKSCNSSRACSDMNSKFCRDRLKCIDVDKRMISGVLEPQHAFTLVLTEDF